MELLRKGNSLNSYEEIKAFGPCNGYTCGSYEIGDCPRVCNVVAFPG